MRENQNYESLSLERALEEKRIAEEEHWYTVKITTKVCVFCREDDLDDAVQERLKENDLDYDIEEYEIDE